jgi:L-asparaginase
MGDFYGGSPPVRVFVTGGTFDKEYDEIHGALFFKGTHLPDMLRLGRSRLDVEVETLMMVDSLDMGDADRERIAAAVADCPERHVVVTHGTDTMVDTAGVIARAARGKTVVLTGAMIPWAFGSSDGLFNLGSALSFAQVLPPGAWIAMNGRFFAWNRVRKSPDRGVFEEVDGGAGG